MPSDSNYSSVARYARRPLSKVSGTPVAVLAHSRAGVDEAWAADKLSDDEVEIARQIAAVAPLLEEGELDADAIVVSPTGNSASAANNAAERRRREEGWNDLGLDQIDGNGTGVGSSVPTRMTNQQE
mmetsp:Transcript_53484/g.59798  ORF Transcript_53484/g.59798 Transcript_53484/m.59798 type:complete len:127 (-) Transcript_53484:116-496(-)